LSFLPWLNGLGNSFAQVSLPIECLLVDLDNLYLAFNLRFLAALHLNLALSDISAVHPLLQLVILLLVHHLLLLQVYLALLSLPLLLLYGLLILDHICIYPFEVLELLHAIFQFDFDVLKELRFKNMWLQ
jgi:hypothetical protein